jgi:hypothetical protein
MANHVLTLRDVHHVANMLVDRGGYAHRYRTFGRSGGGSTGRLVRYLVMCRVLPMPRVGDHSALGSRRQLPTACNALWTR